MSLNVRVITPDKVVWDAAAEEIILPSSTGQLGILTDHAPLLTALDIGVMRLKNDGNWTSIVLMEGFAEVEGNKVTILCNGAEEASAINKTTAQEELERVTLLVDQAETKKEKTRSSKKTSKSKTSKSTTPLKHASSNSKNNELEQMEDVLNSKTDATTKKPSISRARKRRKNKIKTHDKEVENREHQNSTPKQSAEKSTSSMDSQGSPGLARYFWHTIKSR